MKGNDNGEAVAEGDALVRQAGIVFNIHIGDLHINIVANENME